MPNNIQTDLRNISGDYLLISFKHNQDQLKIRLDPESNVKGEFKITRVIYSIRLTRDLNNKDNTTTNGETFLVRLFNYLESNWDNISTIDYSISDINRSLKIDNDSFVFYNIGSNRTTLDHTNGIEEVAIHVNRILQQEN